MLKKVFKAFLISLILNAAGMAVNLLSYALTGRILLYINLGGCDAFRYVGFGIFWLHETPERTMNDPPGHTGIEFEPVSLLVTLVLFFIIALLVIRHREKKKAE